ncbi:NAD(P)-dependent oxidoreductase [Actinomadura rayongensis]|uniref:NAD(P)H-binding protein n=1 Tax=Actinomadura rayongensis TaxID=1429076 RepID=A0A6I4W469_9ACTN|nr:NAD(P)H-binding protein [Actinomadura rayongensis]MXQ63520.1 NAD(P)H-binding protein [Actinomadura rayongensis]
MSRIVVFGAGGRAGRRVVAEAAGRGHEVTAVVRDHAAHEDLAGENVTVVSGNALDAERIAEVSAGHDAAVQAAYQQDLPVEEFFPDSARALLRGLGESGVRRLVLVGIGTNLEAEPGLLVQDTPGFPPEARAFSLGHLAELEVLRAADTEIDWLVLAPPPVALDTEAEATGKYRIGDERALPVVEGAPVFSYADLAVALIDEIESPKHHRGIVAIG